MPYAFLPRGAVHKKLPPTWLMENVSSVDRVVANHPGPKEQVIAFLGDCSGLSMVLACLAPSEQPGCRDFYLEPNQMPLVPTCFAPFEQLSLSTRSRVRFTTGIHPDDFRPHNINISANNLDFRCDDEVVITVVTKFYRIGCCRFASTQHQCALAL